MTRTPNRLRWDPRHTPARVPQCTNPCRGGRRFASTLLRTADGALMVTDATSTFLLIVFDVYAVVQFFALSSIHDLSIQTGLAEAEEIRQPFSPSEGGTDRVIGGGVYVGSKASHCWAHVQGSCRLKGCRYFHPKDVRPCQSTSISNPQSMVY
jgi:hypothetical protein